MYLERIYSVAKSLWLGMTNPPTTTTTVLVFTRNGHMEFVTDSLTVAELEFFYAGSTHDWGHELFSYILRDPARPDDLVSAALMLNFQFLDEAARVRWMIGEPFEMYRENVV
jgi:hypothetical protein